MEIDKSSELKDWKNPFGIYYQLNNYPAVYNRTEIP